MQTLFRVASYLVLPYSPIVHLNLPSQYQLKKHQWWPFSTDGTEAHAYPPVEGMISRLSGGCQLLQQALPPHLALITAGGYALAE